MTHWRQALLALVVLVFVSGGAFSAGVSAERDGLVPGAVRVEPPELIQQFSVFWQAWDLVQENFVDRSAVNPKNLTYGAIEGMLNALGDTGHTRFMTANDVAMQSSDLAGEFQGIGAELGQKDGYPMIVAPLDGSPAEKAGLQAGDVLIQVDGQSVAGLSLDEVVRMVRGPEGKPVTLMVIHPGQGSMTQVTIVRAKIQMHPVSWTMVPGTHIAHIRLSQFSANINRELVAALKDSQAAGATALVVDVRNNSGGLLDQAIAVTSQFLKGGNVLIERDAKGKEKADAVIAGGQATDPPMVVLTNLGTASAAEIFAGAIQDNHRAQVVGDTSFGTGTVLQSFPLSDGSALLLGTSEWLTPGGRQIWKHGIQPDVAVPLPAGSTSLTPSKEKDMTPDQFRASGDAQLLKAVELLGNR